MSLSARLNYRVNSQDLPNVVYSFSKGGKTLPVISNYQIKELKNVIYKIYTGGTQYDVESSGD